MFSSFRRFCFIPYSQGVFSMDITFVGNSFYTHEGKIGLSGQKKITICDCLIKCLKLIK